MTPIQAIEQLDELQKQLAKLCSHLRYEADDIREQWDSLGNVGVQREDRAAKLLSVLRPHFGAIASFASNCEKQIDGMVVDPFETKSTTA